MRGELGAVVALLVMTAIWGSTFVIVKDTVEEMAIGSFLALRFAIATLVLVALVPRAVLRLDRTTVRAGVLLGILYGLGQVLQTWGLANTSPSISGFVTSMYVVFTPLIVAVLVRARVRATTWLAVAIALVGIGVLTVGGSAAGAGIGLGELLTLASAAIYAGHIVALGAWSAGRDAIGLSVVQLATVTVVALASTPLDGRVDLPPDGGAWLAVLYTAIAAGTLALLLQTWAQARIDPSRAAVVMMFEPVFAAGFAVIAGVEEPSLRMLVGGVLVLTSLYVVEAGARGSADAGVVHVGPP
ncbi:MAG: permease [Thermoleophilia bacterium]|nr:permease [Thermoleophilia bacterium]